MSAREAMQFRVDCKIKDEQFKYLSSQRSIFDSKKQYWIDQAQTELMKCQS